MDDLRQVYLTAIENKNENILREKLQIEINSALSTQRQLFAKGLNARQKITKCRQKLRALENCSNLSDICFFESTPLTDFYMNICYACDLALAGTGKRVVFSGGADNAFICREAVMRQALNMISNAALYSDSAVINAELKSFNQYAVFTVWNSTDADLLKIQNSITRVGSGLWYVSRVAQLHGSTALFSFYEGIFQAGIRLKTASIKPQEPVKDFTSLLCDRLSPVYTHLSTVEGI